MFARNVCIFIYTKHIKNGNIIHALATNTYWVLKFRLKISEYRVTFSADVRFVEFIFSFFTVHACITLFWFFKFLTVF